MPDNILKIIQMKKKSQIQIGETMAVLFVFFILIVIGFLFYTKIIKGNIETEQAELSQLKSVGISQIVMFLPELQCSEDNIIIDNCIDVLKLEAAQNLMKQKETYYYDLLEFGEVNVSEIYPGSTRWNIYSREINFTNKFVTNVPVALYNSTAKKYSFGILTIKTLSR